MNTQSMNVKLNRITQVERIGLDYIEVPKRNGSCLEPVKNSSVTTMEYFKNVLEVMTPKMSTKNTM